MCLCVGCWVSNYITKHSYRDSRGWVDCSDVKMLCPGNASDSPSVHMLIGTMLQPILIYCFFFGGGGGIGSCEWPRCLTPLPVWLGRCFFPERNLSEEVKWCLMLITLTPILRLASQANEFTGCCLLCSHNVCELSYVTHRELNTELSGHMNHSSLSPSNHPSTHASLRFLSLFSPF